MWLSGRLESGAREQLGTGRKLPRSVSPLASCRLDRGRWSLFKLTCTRLRGAMHTTCRARCIAVVFWGIAKRSTRAEGYVGDMYALRKGRGWERVNTRMFAEARARVCDTRAYTHRDLDTPGYEESDCVYVEDEVKHDHPPQVRTITERTLAGAQGKHNCTILPS